MNDTDKNQVPCQDVDGDIGVISTVSLRHGILRLYRSDFGNEVVLIKYCPFRCKHDRNKCSLKPNTCTDYDFFECTGEDGCKVGRDRMRTLTKLAKSGCECYHTKQQLADANRRIEELEKKCAYRLDLIKRLTARLKRAILCRS